MRRGGDIAVIAVDGGGTRCRIALWDGSALTSVETGPANASTDADRAICEVLEGLKGLSGASGRTVDDLIRLPAFVGLAGVVDDDIADRLRQALPFEHVRIADDRPAAVRGVLGHADGVLGHCGTGSFHAAQIGGEIRFFRLQTGVLVKRIPVRPGSTAFEWTPAATGASCGDYSGPRA